MQRVAFRGSDAQIALDKVARGEADAINGWLAYGLALNEGRSLFPSDEQFGQWVVENHLHLVTTFDLKREAYAVSAKVVTHDEVNRHERAAAMWAAAKVGGNPAHQG